MLLHGLPRADVGSVFADLPGRERSQFVGHVDLPANQSTPALLKVFAELEDAEIFFDPQTHTARGVPMETVLRGLHRACADAGGEGC